MICWIIADGGAYIEAPDACPGGHRARLPTRLDDFPGKTLAIPLYIVSLALASGATAALARKLLQGFGYVPSLEASVALTLGLALLFAALQLAYLAFMRLAAPSRGAAPYFFESLSNASAILLVPYLAGINLVPYLKAAVGGSGAEMVDKLTTKLSAGLLEPAVLGGAFLAAHCTFKLISFFSATESRPAGRFGAIIWAAAAAACGLGGLFGLERWAATLEEARNVPLADAKTIAVDGAHVSARSLPLGVDLNVPLEGREGQFITMHWALARDYAFPPSEIFVTVSLDGQTPFAKRVPLNAEGWTAFRPLADAVPEGAKSLKLSWDFAQDSPVTVKWGIRRPPSATDAVWAADPVFAGPASAKAAPNFIVVAMDGISTARLKSQGYFRDTMPVLDNLAKSALFFPMGITPAPEAAAAGMSLLTGQSPLRHGYLGKQRGPLSPETKTLPQLLREQRYATAAFTESGGSGSSDLGHGTGFEAGFDYFDPTTPLNASSHGSLPGAPAPPEHAGSAVTLAKAAAWVEDHAQGRFFLFVRLREAGEPTLLSRYGEGFVADRARPAADDVYDTALSNVDKALPAFMDRLKARGLMDSTVVVFTSPFGIDPDRPAAAGATLSDATTVVPVLMLVPGKPGTPRSAIVGLEDIAPTLLQMLDPSIDALGRIDLRDYTSGNERVSVLGDPLVMSLRNRRWRFTWSSGLDPFTREVVAGEAPMALINIEQSRARKEIVDDLGRFPDEEQRGRAALIKYLGDNVSLAP